MTKNLLVIYESSGEEWATYLKELLTLHLQIDDVFLYNVTCESNEMVESLISSIWQCKLLVLTRDILKIFYENQSTNFFELLQPSYKVVLMLCGVNSPEGLYELFSFERDCQVILPDQDPQDYISTVSTLMNEAYGDRNISRPSDKTTEISTWSNIEQEDVKTDPTTSMLVLPKRISCENPGELFIILSKQIPKNTEVEVEFCTKNQLIRKKPKQWSEKILCLRALEFPPGEVTVNVCSGEIIRASTQIEYFSTTEDLKHLLLKTIDPVPFICQAFNVYTLEELDKVLMKSLKNKISSCEYNLYEPTQHRISGSSEEIPTLLHCAAKLGLKEVARLLMQSPAANYISKITNKYGDDPAKMAEKHGHLDIQDIIYQGTKELKANQDDIPGESVEFEQEDIYVDMVECADSQQSSKDSCSNDDDTDPDQVNETEQDAQEYPVEENIEEYVEQPAEYNIADKMLDMTDDYCLLIPADNPSRSFKTDDPCFHDGINKPNEEEEWFHNEYSSEDKGDWQNTECDQDSICPCENMYVPLPIHSITTDLPSEESHDCLSASLPPEDDLLTQPTCFQEENIIKEDVTQGALNECPEKQAFYEYDEEPVVIASTEDDVYIIFDAEEGEKPFIAHRLTTPETSLSPTIAGGTSYISQEERTGDYENVSHGELNNYSDEGNDHDHEEEPLVVASMEDDMYIVFETSVKDKQRGQTSFMSHNPPTPEAASNSAIQKGASYIAQAERKDESFSTPLFWDDHEDTEEDPYSLIYSDDDELYIELPFETADAENPRGRKSFIVHRAPAPAPRPETTDPDIDVSYISKVFRQKEEEKKIYSTGLYQDKVQLAKYEPQVTAQHYALTGQDELILLQEKVKMGIISMDEALQKFQQWQSDKSGLDLLQQKKLQELRNNIIGNKTDDERVYDKITIVHQPNAFSGRKKTNYGMFDDSIYQKPNKSSHLPTPYQPMKKENEMAGRLPHTK
ncbi:B-cell scaffold protein with ankyrin repeats isoform X2 [Eleutherodactylus coqui]|uniref:B-cell scaffold protein with ankyrin repeats isoform X2 n=1 Tax=Eleutherodactylus coqui TaxID=57060 RepID=UPI003462FB11